MKIDGVAVGSNSPSLIYTFPTPKKYVVELTTFYSSYSSKPLASTYEIYPSGASSSAGPLAVSITTNNTGNVLQCDDPGTRDFTATISGCINNPEYEWYYMLEAQGIWVRDTYSTAAQYTFSFSRLYQGFQAFSVKCEVNGYCHWTTLMNPIFNQCPSNPIGFGFTPQSQCQ
ncbi:MAG: hypothetical protein IPJ20_23490 [Flammeovirgaceae bacterium]|nr:hypothetical protein [Flammeovirgaceae bacterium]